jgi:alkanesulfonate monooxygenase SsuD/methylene tetrahydromethanopterin reductase-like flavin-dependent oxidoreductase (luciferase family)
MTSTPRPTFGLYLPQLRMKYDVIEERVRAAERLGFSSAWLVDHLTLPKAAEHPLLEGWTLATFLAARTTTIRIGHLVLCSSFRHPSVLAKMAVTLDELSGGRVDLGLGWGSVEEELHQSGLYEPAAVRSARLREQLEIFELLFTGEEVDYEGTYYRLEGARCRPTPVHGRIPLHIGGKGPKLTLPLVREFADWWNCPSYAIDQLEDLRSQVGDVRISTLHVVSLITDEANRHALASEAERRFGFWGGLIAGSPEEVAEVLSREVELGVEHFAIQFTDFATVETQECFAETVMPLVGAVPA